MRGLLPARTRAPRRRTPSRAADVHWTPALLLLGVIAFCSFVGEGAASDWSAVYMTQELAASPALGAVAFAAFAVTMATRPLRGRPAARPARQPRPGARRLADRRRRPRLRPAGPRAGRGDSRLRAARPRPRPGRADRLQRRGRPRPARHRSPGGPGGNARLRRLGGRPDHDRLAGGGHEPAASARPGGAAVPDDRRLRSASPARQLRYRDDPPGGRSPSVRVVQSGMSQSGNQRAMSSSHGSSAPSWDWMRSSRSVSRACSPLAGTNG